MFRKREPKTEDTKMSIYEENFTENTSKHTVNSILKGSKLTGDINVSYDLELSGEVEGNINSEQNSNIIIKGKCKGNITTKGGNVDIDGELTEGNIISGGNVKITGTFNGGKIEAKGRIYVNGEFNGKLESNEIEIGPGARGKGELFYNEYISIAKGAKVDVKINQIQNEQKTVKKPADMKIINIEQPVKEAHGVN